MKDSLNNTNIALSIIIPVYNCEKYLDQCLTSVITQTIKNIEVIIINDGSTDKSKEIIDRYARDDVRINAVHKKNEGYGVAINTGIKLAKGDYIGIVEADDFAASIMFERLYSIAVEHDVEVVKSNYYFYWSTPNEKKLYSMTIPHDYYDSIVNPIDKDRVFFCSPAIWSAIYKKDFLLEYDIKCIESPGASYQDTSFNFKVWANATRAYLIPDALIYYRQDNENSSVHSLEKVTCVCDEFKEIVNHIPKEKQHILSKIVERMRYNTYIWNFCRLREKNKLTFLEIFSSDFRSAIRSNTIDRKYFSRKEILKTYLVAYTPKLFHILHSIKKYFFY